MKDLEKEFNKRRLGIPSIKCVVYNLDNREALNVKLNALSISDIERNLPDGYELDIIMTLKSYFDEEVMERYSIELDNSQYIYFEEFKIIVEYGMSKYIEALINDDMVELARMDRKYQN